MIRQAGPHVGVVFRQVGLEFFEVLPAKSFEDLDHLEKDFEREEFRPKFWGPLLGLEAYLPKSRRPLSISLWRSVFGWGSRMSSHHEQKELPKALQELRVALSAMQWLWIFIK